MNYKKYVFKYATEFIVIVVGISASFWFESYRSSLEEKHDGIEALISINKELIDVEEYYTERETIWKHDLNVISTINDLSLPNRAFIVDSICKTKDDIEIAVFNYRGFTPPNERYNSIVSEGTLKHIESDKIKTLLSKLHVQYLEMVQGNEKDEVIAQRNIVEHCQKKYPEITFSFSDIKDSKSDYINKCIKAIDNDSHLRAMIRYKNDVMGFKFMFLLEYIKLEKELRNEIKIFLKNNSDKKIFF